MHNAEQASEYIVLTRRINFIGRRMVERSARSHNIAMKITPLLPLILPCLFLAACNQPDEAATMSMLDIAAAPGSKSPNLATGPNGEVVLSWIEPAGEGHALRFSLFDHGHWSAPQTVASGSDWFVNWADFPSVVPISDSLWAAHWLASQPAGGYAYDVRAALSSDGGKTWSESFIPHTDNTPTEHGFVSLFPDGGGVGFLWLDGRKMVNEYDDSDVTASGMTLRTATFTEARAGDNTTLVDDLTCDCCQTDIAITSSGPVAVYRDRTVDEIRDIYVARREGGTWQAGTQVARDDWEIAACPVNGPVIAANGDIVAVAWFTAAGGKPKVSMAWSRDAARTFAAPVDIDTGAPLGHVAGILTPGNDFIAGWLQKSGDGGARMMLQRVPASGVPHAPIELELAANVFAFSVPQLAWAGDRVIAAWTAEHDGEYSVETASVPLSRLSSAE